MKKTAFAFVGVAFGILVGVIGCSRLSGGSVTKDGLTINRLGGAKIERFKLGAMSGWSMKLPCDEHFTPNVNWFVAEFDGNFDEYMEMTDQGFCELSATVISKVCAGEDIVDVEYLMTIVGEREGHFVQRIIKDGKRFHVVTGTTTVPQWERYGAQIAECVKSAHK